MGKKQQSLRVYLVLSSGTYSLANMLDFRLLGNYFYVSFLSFMSKNFSRSLPILIWLDKEDREVFHMGLTGRQCLSGGQVQGKAGTDSTLGWGVVSMDGRMGGGSPRGRGHSQLQMLLLLLDCLLPLAPLYIPEMTILEQESFSIFQSRLHKDGCFFFPGSF